MNCPKWIILSSIFYLVGCAQINPIRSETLINLCGLSIQFSDVPTALSVSELKSINIAEKVYGNYYEWKSSGFYVSKKNSIEVVTCSCKENKLLASTFGSVADFLRSIDAINIKEFEIQDIGLVISYYLNKTSQSHRHHYQLISPVAEESCLLYQHAQYPENALKKATFFSPVTATNVANHLFHSKTVKDRIKELDSLRQEDLITDDEYETKKKSILDTI